MKNIMYKILNKINFEKLGTYTFITSVLVIISAIASLWLLLPGVIMYFTGMYMIAYSNDIHRYYERKIKFN
jgi:hypothetical protein